MFLVLTLAAVAKGERNTRDVNSIRLVLHTTVKLVRALVFLDERGKNDAASAAGAGTEGGVELLELSIAARVEEGENARLERALSDDADSSTGDGADDIGEEMGAVTL